MSGPPPPPPKLPPPLNPPADGRRPPPLRIATRGTTLTAALQQALDVTDAGGRPDAGAAGDATRTAQSKFSGSELHNFGHDLLVYESIFNHIQFQHTPKRLPLAAYSFPLEKLRIILLPGLSEHALERIRNAFFPSVKDNNALRACCYQPWDGDWSSAAEGRAKGNGNRAHMPYNAVANDETGIALGTRAMPPPPGNPAARKLVEEWAMWQTASRSCIVELAPSGSWKDDPAAPRKSGADSILPWDFANGDTRIKGYRDVLPQLSSPRGIKRVLNFQDAGGGPLCFSIKTGVVYVGAVNQSSRDSGEKGTLEKDSLAAALRSNYVIAVEQFLTAQKAPALESSRRLIVLPEALTVTCTDPSLDGKTGDGFQLRDLNRLDQDKLYFPPLSIPYIARTTDSNRPIDFNTRSEYFAGLAETPKGAPATAPKPSDWAVYWSTEFAARVGQTKAILHLVYGLQALTPNAQNFLLEADEQADMLMMFSGRVAVRDILDMKLHTDWVATIFGDRPNPFSTTSVSLADVKFKDPQPVAALLNYEKTARSIFTPTTSMIADSETFADQPGRTPYYKGTQLNWFPYTSLHRGSSVATGGSSQASAGPARIKGWQMILYVNTLWGLEHAINYASAVNALLDPDNPANKPLDPKKPKPAGTGKKDEIGPPSPIDYLQFFNGTPLNFTHRNLLDGVNGVRFLSGDAKAPTVKVFGTDADANSAPFAFVANALEIQKLSDDDAGYRRAGEMFDLFSQWERSVSSIIHNAIYDNEDVRKKLRKFHGLL